MDPKDLRIEGYRDGSVHWRGHYRIVHLPTGMLVEYDCTADDFSEKNQEALKKLEDRVAHPWRYPAAQ